MSDTSTDTSVNGNQPLPHSFGNRRQRRALRAQIRKFTERHIEAKREIERQKRHENKS